MESKYKVDYKLLWSNEGALEHSASGGVFYLVANAFLKDYDTAKVYGCIFSNENKVIHVGITEKSQLSKFQGSKYVQSDMSLCFKSIYKELNEGVQVLFSGTACQVVALKKYLHESYENLYTVDVICHGVPSPLLWDRYVEYLEKKFGGHVGDIRFRNKSRTNRLGYILSFMCNENKYIVFPDEDPYYKAFIEGKSLRPSCYKCPYTDVTMHSDISIGDSNNKKFHSSEAVSLVIINSEKGQQLLELIENKCDCYETSFETESSENKKMVKPASKPNERAMFYEIALGKGIEYICPMVGIKIKLKNRIKNIIPTTVKDTVKKIIKRED
ncbi:MAG: Coenzyme F420 hydrogenase/dehydrogenase, beta subunit C-terminal domain [Velocimicrobium sp.]